MPITNHLRDNWCRFQGELFPEIQGVWILHGGCHIFSRTVITG